MKVRYSVSSEALAQFDDTLRDLATSGDVHRICEIGGGAHPALSVEFVRSHGLDYTVLDISQKELDKAPAEFHKICTNICSHGAELQPGFDFIFSQWCAEHVPDGRQFHENIFKLLKPGGYALHLFPTLYSPPFVVNWLLPEWLTSVMVRWLQPYRFDNEETGKFPALYRWCRGPTRSQIRRLQSVGFDIQEYAGFFGHSGNVAFYYGYLNRLPPLARLHEKICRFLARVPNPLLTSIAYVVLQKPNASISGNSNARDIANNTVTSVTS